MPLEIVAKGEHLKADTVNQIIQSINRLDGMKLADGYMGDSGFYTTSPQERKVLVVITGNDGETPPGHTFASVVEFDKNSLTQYDGSLENESSGWLLYDLNGEKIADGTLVEAWQGANDCYYCLVGGNGVVKVKLDDDSVIVDPTQTLEFDHLGYVLIDESDSTALIQHRYGTVNDIQPVGEAIEAGTLGRVARADHVHSLNAHIVVPLSICPIYGSGSPYMTGVTVEYGIVDVLTSNIIGNTWCRTNQVGCCPPESSTGIGSGSGGCPPAIPSQLCLTITGSSSLTNMIGMSCLMTYKTSFTPFLTQFAGNDTFTYLGPPAWDSGWVPTKVYGVWIRGYLACNAGVWTMYVGYGDSGGLVPAGPPADNDGANPFIAVTTLGPGVLSVGSSSAGVGGAVGTGASGTASITKNLTGCGGNACQCALVSPGHQANNEGDVVQLQLQTNPDCTAPLSFTASGLPTGLSIATLSGKITGTVATGAHTGSIYSVTITCTDANACSSSLTFSWAIGACVCAISSISSRTNTELDTPAFNVFAPACTAGVTWTISGAPSGITITSNGTTTGLINGTIQSGASSGSPYTVTVTAIDANGCTGSRTFNWTVNPPPSLCGCTILPSTWIFMTGVFGTCSGLGGLSWVLTSTGIPCTWYQNQPIAGYSAALTISGGIITLIIANAGASCVYTYSGSISGGDCMSATNLNYVSSSPTNCCGGNPSIINVTGVP
jgi:putative Ig domain-containing protein